jgi:tripartite-type tricarboxylate transporter receptor subunit TctC
MKHFPRRRFLRLAAGAVAVSAMSRIASVQAYPTRPVRFIVPLAAGGGLDFAARLIGEYLSRTLIAGDVVSSGPYVVQFNTDYVKNLMPLIELTRYPTVLAVHPSLGVSSIAELVSAAKLRLGLGYASSGVGTQQHFVGEWFAKLAGIKQRTN